MSGRTTGYSTHRDNGRGPFRAIPHETPEHLRGDAWEPPGPEPEPEQKVAGDFPEPVVASRLVAAEQAVWLWDGYLARGHTTLLSALWKAGKTTLLAHLLHALGGSVEFCGQSLVPGNVLYVSEESSDRWVERRDEVGIGDNVRFLLRPFLAKPSWDQWILFLAYLNNLLTRQPADLLILDTIVSLWPVRDENDASQIQSALMPLWTLPASTATLLVHHNRKADGAEATATRGSGAFPGFVDTIVELRRFRADDPTDCRRVLTGMGRWDCTPAELVVERGANGFSAEGTRRETWARELAVTIARLLPCVAPGFTLEDVVNNWPAEKVPTKQRLLDALRAGTEAGTWHRSGHGHKTSPFVYWTDAPQ